MNLHTINIIIAREYLNKVKKKSFIILTFVAPLLFAALCILPSVIMFNTKEAAKKIAVVDRSGIVMPFLESGETVTYTDLGTVSLDSLKANMGALGYDGVLAISELDSVQKTVTADVFSGKPLGVDLVENMGNRLDDAVEAYRIGQYNIENLETIMKDVKADVRLHSYTLDEEGKETISESGVYMMVSMILGMIIYMFIAIFGGMVMSSVIEEKSSRVVEVLVSSVKATELMFGKIIGIALVALTQFFLWIVLTVAIVGVAGGIMGKKLMADNDIDPTEIISGMDGMGVDAEQMASITDAMSDEGELSVIMTTLRNLPIGRIIFSFFIYFVFGYMLYASLYAAIGSAVENEGDTQQLQLPVTIPLLIAFFIAFYAFKAPDSGVVFWGSIIPFTSPIVMLARIPFGVPAWQLAVSLVALVLTFCVCAWASAKIYKVGILMFGKKSTWKDLWKWLKQN